MRAQIITLLAMAESMAVAHRCHESAQRFGIRTEIWPATHWNYSAAELRAAGLRFYVSDCERSDRAIACFMSHYRLWKHIAATDPMLILEHDAVFMAEVPDLTGKGDIINLGEPSYGAFCCATQPGVQPFFSNKLGNVKGSHAYYVTPAGARQLIAAASKGARAVDDFIALHRFPELKELYPWPVRVEETFSTVQTRIGCRAKRGYSEQDYKLL